MHLQIVCAVGPVVSLQSYVIHLVHASSCAGLSYNSILGKLMLFSTDVEVSRKMLSVNDESSLLMAVHPSAKAILGPNNLAFMHGPAHKAIRKSFLALFTRKALGTYVELQDGIVRAHISQWLAANEGREIEIRPFIRRVSHPALGSW